MYLVIFITLILDVYEINTLIFVASLPLLICCFIMFQLCSVIIERVSLFLFTRSVLFISVCTYIFIIPFFVLFRMACVICSAVVVK